MRPDTWRTPLVILVCGTLALLISFGVRQVSGLFIAPVSADLGWGRDVFSLAIAVQALMWGVFPPPVPSKTPPPALIYIHGGYWQLSDKSDTSFVAPAFAAAGVAFISLNYALAPSIDVDGIVGQVRAAIAWVWRNAADLEIDRDRIVVAGHSAGGHLATMAAATDWPVFASDLPADPIRAACGISGLYDLEPIRLCYLNRVLELDAGAAMRNSPIAVSPRLAGPILLAVGGDETDEFLRQQTTLTERWRETGAEIRAMLIPSVHHYSIIRALADADSTLFRAVCGLATAK